MWFNQVYEESKSFEAKKTQADLDEVCKLGRDVFVSQILTNCGGEGTVNWTVLRIVEAILDSIAALFATWALESLVQVDEIVAEVVDPHETPSEA